MIPPQKARARKPLAIMAILACTGSHALFKAGGSGIISRDENVAMSMRIVTTGLTNEPKFLTLYLQWKER
jgi:hypothetical protein